MDVFKTDRPEALIALASAMAGGLPSTGVLVLFFTDRRAGVAGRVERPDLGDVDAWAAAIESLAIQVGANGILPIFIGDETDETETRNIAAQLIEHSELRVMPCLMVTAQRWLHLHDATQSGTHQQIADAAEELGVGYTAERVEYGAAAIPPALPEDADQAAALAVLARDDREEQFAQLPDLVDEVLAGEQSIEDAEVAARIIHALATPTARDALLTTVLFDAARGHEMHTATAQWLAGDQEQPLIAEMANIVMGLVEISPDYARLDHACRIVHELTQRAPQSYRAAMLTTLSWLHYATGRSGTAIELVRAARKLDSEHSFAKICETVIEASTNPVWIDNRTRTHQRRAADQ